ncbi:DUF1275 family protein [Nocardiopsis kunsanensis]|uniref:DUF1275 family protein n=1 Tax=Nocardiopsis kunsanensis TaxID=141693 RepID=UPI0003478359|nr:DUF1275 family protein [Nocardiopsis kunsanensis]
MRRSTALAALTACAGGMDLLSVTALGGVFSGITTGNLVHAGHGAGTAHWPLAATAAGAVAAFATGAALASRTMGPSHEQTRARMRLQLALQTTVVALFAAGWLLVRANPGTLTSPLLLGTAALAMGAQSAWARQNGTSTTYLTGTLTAAVADTATGQGLARHRWDLTRLACLLAGATTTTLVLVWWAPAAALVPAACALAGAALWWPCPHTRT